MEPITIITLIVSMAACLLTYIFKKVYANRSLGGMTGIYVYSAIGCIVSSVILLLWGGFGDTSAYTVILGILFGIVVSLEGIFVTVAMKMGPMAYTMVIVSCSTVFTALSGFFFFDEEIGVLQLVGIALMVGSFVFATEKKEGEKKGGFRWLLFSLLAFIFSGAIGFMQKTHQAHDLHKGELNSFLVLAFIVSFVFSAVLAFTSMKKEKLPLIEKNKAGKVYWLLIIIMIASGICVAANHKFNLALSGEIPSAVFFPIVNGGNLVLTTLSALIIFKERLTKRQWIGVILGIASVLFLCMPTGWIFSFELKEIVGDHWSYSGFINSLK